MDPIFRPDLTRIILTGSESTGKTTLAAQLAAHYGVEFVPEFVREYAATKGEPVIMSDHGAIARGQMAWENEYAERANGLLFQDADLISTVAYYTHYSGGCPQWIVDEAQKRQGDLYLLAYVDTPWIADGIRDRGDRRDEMHQVFIETLTKLGANYVELRGIGEQRKTNAIKLVDDFRISHPLERDT
jgi:NadR type nicotinamide-nucleotide adenylyltransferase